MSDEIIVVDDSSEDELEQRQRQPLSPATATARAKATKSNRGSVPSDNKILEILDSDDEKMSSATFEEQMNIAKRQSLDSLMDRHQNCKQSSSNNYKRVSLSQSSTSKKCRGHDSDSDDDSLLNYSAFDEKRPAAVAAAAAATTCTTPSNPSNTNVAATQSTSSSASSKTTSIVNPYAKARKTPSATNTKPASSSSIATPNATMHRTPTLTFSVNKPIFNPYSSSSKKKKATASKIATAGNSHGGFPYPRLLTNSKQYPDIRAKCVLALWKYARKLTLHSHERPRFDHIMNNIVDIVLLPYPLRSLDEFYSRVRQCSSAGGGGMSTRDHKSQVNAFKAHLDEGGFLSIQISTGSGSCNGRYCSIIEACLVTMATEIDRRIKQQQSPSSANQPSPEQLSSKDMFISLEFLIPEIEKRLLPECPSGLVRQKDADHGEAYYLNPSTRSAEYYQIKKLASDKYGLIKERKQKKKVVFELTPKGYQQATIIKTRIFPAPSGHYRTSSIESLADVQPTFEGICLAMDFREGGQMKQVLHRMCNKLELVKIPYFVGTLDVGDYAFFRVGPSQDQGKMLPLLVERKSIQDVAQSISDGRWESQKQRMYHGQMVFGYDNSRICFIIEGKEEKQQVSGGFIGHRKFGVDRQRLDEAINGLTSEGFDVLRTTSPEHSMFKLSRFAETCGKDVREGKLTVKYTFEDFKEQVKKIPKETDFSRIAKYHMQARIEREKKEKVDAKPVQAASGKVAVVRQESSESPTTIFKENDEYSQATKHIVDDVVDLCDSDDDYNNTEKHDESKSKSCTLQTKKQTEESGKNVKVKSQSASKSTIQQTKKQTKVATNPKAILKKETSNSIAAIVRPPFRKPSAEVQAYFCNDDDGGDSDSDDSTLARVRKAVAKHKQKKEKKQYKRGADVQEEVKRSAKKQKTAHDPQATATTKKTDNKTESCEDLKPKVITGEYEDWSSSQLKEKCEEYGLPKNGTRADLMERLRGPKPPHIWLERKKAGLYVPPRHDTASVALLAALYLHERDHDDDGMTKDELYVKAEGLEITKNPFSGGTTQTGPYHYDGWSSVPKLLEGEVPLVAKKKGRFKLTNLNGRYCGSNIARAVHRWSHEYNKCQCGSTSW